MLWFAIAYLTGGLLATLLYVRFAHRLPDTLEPDPEALWWEAFAQARERLGHDPSPEDVIRQIRKAA